MSTLIGPRGGVIRGVEIANDTGRQRAPLTSGSIRYRHCSSVLVMKNISDPPGAWLQGPQSIIDEAQIRVILVLPNENVCAYAHKVCEFVDLPTPYVIQLCISQKLRFPERAFSGAPQTRHLRLLSLSSIHLYPLLGLWLGTRRLR